MEKLPNILYKYQSFEDQYSLINLINCQVYFQDPTLLNDPFDCTLNPIIKNLNSKEKLLLHNRYISSSGNNISFDDFINNTNDVNFGKQTQIHKMITEFYQGNPVLCLSKLYNSILMWSYYSEKHSGFCLGFDTRFEPFNKAFRVNYKKEFPLLRLMDLISKNQRDVNKRLSPLLTKYHDWKHEKEFRAFHSEKPTTFKYPLKALTDIYLGLKISDLNKEKLLKIVSDVYKNNVNVWEAKPIQQQYQVKFNKLDLALV